ncbi:hypothetical protein DPSP01_008099 [Paraphaeosphaeria sporulosa]|uniref:Uncharacterized protein n=1 Tax=Paraphaeosphaeria sporulosa TaxID=1460663 RepID=A0A177CPW7_9PLEO|nr:uncharacterized protein CC84DRAFT_597760 [Paraphaeosphaeria sporulosa]OAG08930.1 hypothetical protein CC84DRAFT_597760 [Paraphaeosphaeria sporulosa]
MIPESQYCQMQAVMPEVKQLFQSRRYIQCANVCERFLSHHYDEIHPVHRVYLHFYFALVHDTMARETTLKHRSTGLELAEHHYRAAIEILTPSEPYNLDDLLSPLSPTSEYLSAAGFHRLSRLSFRSAASSMSEDEDRNWDRVDSPYDDTPSPTHSFRSGKPRPTPITTFNASRAYHEDRFSAELFALLPMLHAHLRGVKQLKSDKTTPRCSFSRSRTSTWSSRPQSRDSTGSNESELDQLRSMRKNLNFRPKFDPADIQKLCNEALAEL